MKKHSPFRYFKTSPKIIRLTVMLYVRFLWAYFGLLSWMIIGVSYGT